MRGTHTEESSLNIICQTVTGLVFFYHLLLFLFVTVSLFFLNKHRNSRQKKKPKKQKSKSSYQIWSVDTLRLCICLLCSISTDSLPPTSDCMARTSWVWLTEEAVQDCEYSLRGSPTAKSPVWPRGLRIGQVRGGIVKEMISSPWQHMLFGANATPTSPI